MPGLSQLKKFNADILSLGDEVSLRAARGEQPVLFSIPKEIEDIDDSEDFVLGMPEIEAETIENQIDDDLSDITGIATGGDSGSGNDEAQPAPSFEAPDLSSLLNPINIPDDASAGESMPDLSMFMEPEEEEIPEEEPEPEEISIADMGLDALLAGAGFDAPEEEEAADEEPDSFEIPEELKSVIDGSDNSDSGDIESLDEVETLEEPAENTEPDYLSDFENDLAALDDIPGVDENAADFSATGDADLSSIFDDLPKNEELPEVDSIDAVEDVEVGGADSVDSLEGLGALDDLESLGDFDLPDEIENVESAETFDIPEDIETAENFDVPEEVGTAESVEEPFDFGTEDSAADTFDVPEEVETAESVEEPFDFGAEDSAADTFDIPEDIETAETFDVPEDLNDTPVAENGGADFDLPDDLSAPDTFDLPDDLAASDSFDADAALNDLGGLNDSGDFENSEVSLEDFGIPSADIEDAETVDESLSNNDAVDFDVPDSFDNAGEDTFDLPDDFDTGTPSNLFDVSDVEIPDYGDDADSLSTDGLDDNGEGIEEFDTSEMEGLDFPETDSQLDGAASDFDLGSSDEFPMEGSFEIPGFSDVETAKEEKSASPLLAKGKDKKAKKKDALDEPDFEGAIESENLPPNTLSDAQYKKFIKNLSEYPLNVRLAFENLIVQDEFTDDAEFEIIEKILQKAPARQVASHLEKMLDISIPVPRDFEHRTAEEYEAYKKSLSYQLKNKIIPGALIGILLIFVGIGAFNFGKHCIYIPAKANSLYKQGYALLQSNEYPQSEMKFEEAVKYRLSKKWFFNYARGYREHKQYQRAGQMYTNILRCFNHDKTAGLEYADMELNDLADYETAETIVKREILDYHINDSDSILLLGDIFLEWGTEKDSSKLEDARAQYATLMQLYGASDLYLSRMMRYFIRTDNFREVLQLKQTFEPREKSLNADDWTELSGYLLDKSYGPISPSELYLRYQIEGLRKLLLRAAHANPQNPIALYNLSRYFVQTQETGSIEQTLKSCIEKFNALDSIKRRDIYKYIDSYRLLGEYYIDTTDYLQALEQFAEGIHLYTTERDNAGFEGTPKIGKLYEDFGNIKYFISGDYDEALENYKNSVELDNDSPEMRYRIGYIQYKNKNYLEALGSFMKAGEGNVKERNLLQAMANTLSLRGDDYAAEGYYEQLINNLNREIENKGIVLPQTVAGDYDVVNTYLSAANNYGVTLHRLAKRTGNSALNAQAIVQFSQSVRAWDALTRNQESLVRLSGSNLAEQNILYVTHSMPDFEPSIYIDIKKTLTDAEGI